MHSACAQAASSSDRQTVCVTGAGGFISSWLVKLLLEKGYTIKGTVRNPEDPKNDHLRALEGASERLILCRAELLNYQSLKCAIYGCVGVFHTAFPLSNDPDKILEPAVEGTVNVIHAAAEAGVRRVVFTSTVGAVYMDPNRDQDAVLDESCWSDLEYCKVTKNWYCYAKTIAEQAAWRAAKELGLELVSINPALVVGPLLQAAVNVSTMHVLKYLNGSAKTYINAVQGYIDVRDVAVVHLLVFESATACGRYLCIERVMHRGELISMLSKLFPQYLLPSKCSDEVNLPKKLYKFNNNKIKDLGLQLTTMKQSLYDTVKSLQEKGHLPVVSPSSL